MRKISLLWYPKFIVYVSLYFCLDQTLNILLNFDRLQTLLGAALISLCIVLYKKYFMRKSIDLFAKHIIADKAEAQATFKKLWPNILAIGVAVVLHIFLKLPFLWMTIAWHIVIVKEYKEIYTKALAQLGSPEAVEKELNDKSKVVLILLIAYFLVRFFYGFLAG